MTGRYYVVRAVPKYPAWDEKDGWTETLYAKDRAAAIKAYRRRIADAGHGQCLFTARQADAWEIAAERDSGLLL